MLRAAQDGVAASPPPGFEARLEAAESSAVELLASARRAAGPESGRLDVDALVELVDLWPDTGRDSLPRLLSILVSTAQGMRTAPEAWVRLLEAGRGAPGVPDVIAGLPADLDPAGLVRLAESIVTRSLAEDLGDGLLRTAALLRLCAAGRRALSAPGSVGEALRQRADHELAQALECERGAAACRSGLIADQSR